MKYLQIPHEITLSDLKAKGASWSSGMYRRIQIPTSRTRSIREIVTGYDKGSDPGSMYYMQKSTHYFIRTKSLQAHSYLISSKGGAITPINPRVFEDMALAQLWLSQPHPALGGMTPNECARNELDLQKALDLMAELKHSADAGSATKQNVEK